ncbi:MAG: response regulator [Bdellovibrionales bacterium]
MAYDFLKNKTFLIVDDEQATVDIVKEVLKQNGATGTGVVNPSLVSNMLAKETFDCVVLDRYMPQMDGHDVLKSIKSNNKTSIIPVIMLTGERQVFEIQTSLSLGASGYVVKPFTPKSFLSQLKKNSGC